jgi:hypothetical protein
MFPMKYKSLIVALIGATSALTLPGRSDPPARAILPPIAIAPTQAKNALVVRNFGRLPLSFERNQGQTDSRVRFLTHSGADTLFLTPSEAVFTLPSYPRNQLSQGERRNALRATEKRRQVTVRMQMVGSNPKATAMQQQPLAGRINYFLGKAPNKWQAGVPTFGRVGFHQVYPGVDLVYYGNQKHLEYDFLVAPRADPKQVKLHFAGAQGVHINTVGDLIVRVQGRELTWRKPTVYQQDAAGKRSVPARFRLKRLPNGQAGVGFALGRYDTNRPLVIDPVLLYSTFLGGSAFGSASSIAIDSSGDAYITGITQSIDFPTTAGAFQRVNHGPGVAADYTAFNVFVTKLNPTGTALIYSTYLGGSNRDIASGIAIDSSDSAYVTGQTSSPDFPTTPGAFQTVNNVRSSSHNAFVTKLNPTGSALAYSTYLGGSAGDSASSIAVDSGGNAYIAGSAGSADFPTTPNAFQTVLGGGDGSFEPFVTKINPSGTALVYSTYLGGSGGDNRGYYVDQATGIAIDSSGNAYITGSVSSPAFPTTEGAFQRVYNALGVKGYNAFVTKLNPTGTALIYSTYLGGNGGDNNGGYYGDQAAGIAIDSSGNAYITGYARSPDFPTTPGAFQRVKNEGANSDVFVTKLNPAGTALIYSTFIGGSAYDMSNGIAIDSRGDVYITGSTDSSDFPTTPGAFQRTNMGGQNAFVIKLNSTATALVYSTYLGRSSADMANAIATDSNGNAYVTGYTYSTDFPTTPGAFQRINLQGPGSYTAFVTKLSTNFLSPDFNNDGRTDLLIQNSTTNVIASWFMNGSTWISGAYFSLTPPSDYALVGVGDFSGNGATTLVLQSRTTNQIAFWYTSGTNNATIPGGNFLNTTPPVGWKVVGVGDFNGDGKSDLVLQNQTTNQVALWFMNGANYAGGVLMPFTPPTGWTVAGVGDFNTDGFPDIAFQNQNTSQIALWYMNGSTYVGGTVLTTVPASGWKVVGVGDYNGDGSADLLFQNQTSNQAAVWYLKNGAFAGGDVLSLAPPSGWKIVGPR